MPQMGKSKFRGETTHSRHSLTCFQVKGDEPGFKCKPAECQATALMLQCTPKPEGVGGHDVHEPLEKAERGAADSVGWVPGSHHQAPKRN